MPTLQMRVRIECVTRDGEREREWGVGGGEGETTDNIFYYDGHFFWHFDNVNFKYVILSSLLNLTSKRNIISILNKLIKHAHKQC